MGVGVDVDVDVGVAGGLYFMKEDFERGMMEKNENRREMKIEERIEYNRIE